MATEKAREWEGRDDLVTSERGAHDMIDLTVAERQPGDEVDALTALFTIGTFRRKAEMVIGHKDRVEEGLSILYLDIMDFHIFNEHYGYDAGDALLQGLASTISSAYPGYLKARITHDRFVVLCYQDHLAERVGRMSQFVRAVRRDSSIELKCGVCPLAGTNDIMVAIDRAKLACDSIKGRYDVDYRIFDDNLRLEEDRRSYIVEHLDEAIAKKTIQVHFQPLVRTMTGNICGFEALARWEDPVYGKLYPGGFIDVLERGRLIHKLDIYVLKSTCRLWRKLIDEGEQVVPVSVNLSRYDFQLCDIHQAVLDAADSVGMPHRLLRLEITESAINAATPVLAEGIRRFRAMGFPVWMDDFGSGLSSLRTLQDFEFDCVKIDMVFIRGVGANPRSRTIVAAVVDMCKRLGMHTLIEGVETEQQRDFVRSIGCEVIQGYYYGKPEPLAHHLKRIRAGEVQLELEKDRRWWEALGLVNPLSPAPFAIGAKENEGMRTMQDTSLALVQWRGGTLEPIAQSPEFERLLKECELGDAEDSASLDCTRSERGEVLRELVARAQSSGAVESVDIQSTQGWCTLRARVVARREDGTLGLVIALHKPAQMSA